MNKLISKVALGAAAAMAVSLASPVTAHAGESGERATFKSAPQSSAGAALKTSPSTAAPSALGSFSLRNGAINNASSNAIVGTIAPNVNGSSFKAEVRVNGVYKGLTSLYTGGIYYTGSWGSGTVRLGPVHYYSSDTRSNQVAQEYSNTFRVRQGLHPKGGLKLIRRGSKLTFKVKKIRSFNGARYVAVNKAIVQVKKGKKWRKLRKVKLNKKGNKTFSIRHSGKRKYRLVVKTNKKVQGDKTRARKI